MRVDFVIETNRPNRIRFNAHHRTRMPLFSRTSFRTPRKPPPRKSDSLPNISHLDESTYSARDLQLDGGPVRMKLGGSELVFEEGQWVVAGAQGAPGSKEFTKLQKQNLRLLEENNMYKYKVELLLDMLAASNADCLVLQRELNALKKVQTPVKR